MPLARQALATVLLAAAGSALAAPASAPEAGQGWQAYPQQYPLPQFVGGGTIPGERPRGAAPAAALPARTTAAPAAFAAAPARCDPGLEPGGLRPKAGIRSVPDLSAPVVSWNTDWSQGCFSPEAGGYRRAALTDGRAGHVKDELVEVGPQGWAAAAPAVAAYRPAPAAYEAPPSALGAAPAPATVAEGPHPTLQRLFGIKARPTSDDTSPSLEVARAGPGLGVAFDQTLESDRIRQAWLARGGNIGAVEFSAGASFMFQEMEAPGMTMTSTGAGFSLSTRFSRLVFSPPQYERRDRSWGAFKFGAGTDLSFFSVTNETKLATCTPYACTRSSDTSTSSMQSFSLVGTLGFTRAFGQFTSPTKWSGVSLGIEWAPNYTMTSTSAEGGPGGPSSESTSSAFNATGFAVSIEGGSLEALTAKLAKKAHLKLRLFVLPPVSGLPLFVNASVGAVLY
jgi:hypothetical protein